MGDVGESRCQRCSAPLSAEPRYCANCGQARQVLDATVVDLRPIASAVPSRAQTAMVTSAPPNGRRVAAIAGALAVFGLVVVAVAGGFGGGDSSGAPAPTPSTSTTEPEAEPELTSTTSAPTTSASTTTAVRPSTTLLPITTSIPYVNQRPGLVLDAAQAGRSLYVAEGPTLHRIELGTGRVTSRDLTGFDPRGFGDVSLQLVSGRVLIGLGSSNLVVSLPADLRGDPLPVNLGSFEQPVATRDGLWVWRYTPDPRQGHPMRLVDLNGGVLAEIALPQGATLVGTLRDGVMIAQHGRLWMVNRDGRVSPYAVGTVVAANDDHVLWIGCDDVAHCSLRLGTSTIPDSGRTSLDAAYHSAEEYGFGPRSRSLAPDGATFLGVAENGEGNPALIDLATGSETAAAIVAGSRPPLIAWTPDGDWLISRAGGGEFSATNARTGRVMRFSVPIGVRDGAIAIG